MKRFTLLLLAAALLAGCAAKKETVYQTVLPKQTDHYVHCDRCGSTEVSLRIINPDNNFVPMSDFDIGGTVFMFKCSACGYEYTYER